MKVFRCDHCEQDVFFENVNCLACGRVLAYLPDIGDMAALEPEPEGLWRSLSPASGITLYRLCENYRVHAVCNWAVRDNEDQALCRACRLTRVAPDLEQAGNLDAWRRLEIAKRRLVYSLLDLGLPLADRTEDPAQGLAYDFLADGDATGIGAVLTGHTEGVIVINLAEADDLEREKRRLSLHEPYRTLLGHFRHEVGHYYWDLLIRDGERLETFRAAFGDERADYGAALRVHYEHGAPAGWQSTHVSSYASAHPWEDWAETWAHYLHMVDTLETAQACGVSIRGVSRQDPEEGDGLGEQSVRGRSFDSLIADWLSLTIALNHLNRSLGLPDGYPFVLATAAVEKLRYVHETLLEVTGEQVPDAEPVREPAPSKEC